MKKEVAYFMERLYRQQLTTTSGGNISLRLNDNEIYITPSGVDKGRLAAEDICVIDINGNIISAEHKLSMETEMHLSIYRKRPDVLAIVHAHPPYATSYSIMNRRIDTKITGEPYFVLGNLAFAEYSLMGTKSLAEKVSEKALESNVIIMENHGTIAVGNDLLQAFDRLEVLEFAAKMNFITDVLKDRNPLNDDQVKEIDSM